MTPTEIYTELDRLQDIVGRTPANSEQVLDIIWELIRLIKELPELKTE